MRLLIAAALMIAALATATAQPVDPQQLADYIAMLLNDRAQQMHQLDALRLQLEQQKRACADHDAAVDAYWRAYTGLKPRG
jgi:hypothetical protein